MTAKIILTNSQASYFHQGNIAEVKYLSHTLLQLHIRSSYNKRQANNGETFRVFFTMSLGDDMEMQASLRPQIGSRTDC